MTIDEAIAHSEEVAEEQDKYCPTPDGVSDPHKQCAEEHRQLADWLKELKEKRQAIEDIRAEIETFRNKWESASYDLSECALNAAYNHCLEIIDRHIGKEQE